MQISFPRDLGADGVFIWGAVCGTPTLHRAGPLCPSLTDTHQVVIVVVTIVLVVVMIMFVGCDGGGVVTLEMTIVVSYSTRDLVLI